MMISTTKTHLVKSISWKCFPSECTSLPQVLEQIEKNICEVPAQIFESRISDDYQPKDI